MRDEIVDEVRKACEDYARQFNFDLDAICRDLRQRQQSAGVPVVSLPKRSVEYQLPNTRPRNGWQGRSLFFPLHAHEMRSSGLSTLSLRVPRLACPTVLPALLDKPAVAPNV
jgi:hypothetical protein